MSLIEFTFEPLGGHRFRLTEINGKEWIMELKDGRGEIYVPTLQIEEAQEKRVPVYSRERQATAISM